jgi:MFS family permease
VTEISASPRSLWSPLRTPVFRNLLLANVVSDIGSFMQNVGAAWLMVSLHAGPMNVALIQTAATLPFLLLALPAGAIGDMVDRRRLILVTESWMLGVAALLAVATLLGWMQPWLLLVLTFALSAGDAFESPSWRAMLPELVSREDLASAAALNGIEFNIARAVGPALAGLLIAAAGVATGFSVNALSFVGVLIVIARWKRSPRQRTTPPESLPGATVAALRYVWYSPGLRGLIARSGAVLFFASCLFALLPTVAQEVHGTALGYGFLLGSFGLGAIAGALLLQPLRARWSTERIATTAIVLLALAMAATGFVRALLPLVTIMVIAGAAWLAFLSLVSALAQSLAPEWVRARAMAVFLLVTQGCVAAGSALWGSLATGGGLGRAFAVAGAGALLAGTLGWFLPLADAPADISPWVHHRVPAVLQTSAPDLDAGPVLVTIEYQVEEARAEEFLRAIHAYGRIRRRDGASRWEVFRDLERQEVYLETFLVSSWGEHLRQHERTTQADLATIRAVEALVRGSATARHLVHVDSSG